MYQCGYILKDQVELRKTNFKVKLQSIIPFIYVFETERNAIYYLWIHINVYIQDI